SAGMPLSRTPICIKSVFITRSPPDNLEAGHCRSTFAENCVTHGNRQARPATEVGNRRQARSTGRALAKYGQSCPAPEGILTSGRGWSPAGGELEGARGTGADLQLLLLGSTPALRERATFEGCQKSRDESGPLQHQGTPAVARAKREKGKKGTDLFFLEKINLSPFSVPFFPCQA